MPSYHVSAISTFEVLELPVDVTGPMPPVPMLAQLLTLWNVRVLIPGLACAASCVSVRLLAATGPGELPSMKILPPA